MKRLFNFVAASLSIALLVACGGNPDQRSQSSPNSVEPFIAQRNLPKALLNPFHTSSDNLYVANSGSGSAVSTVTVYAPGGEAPLRTISEGVDLPKALAFDR